MKLKDIFTLVTDSVAPMADVHYHLYSLPSFDEAQTREEVMGSEIMSNKYAVPNKCILFNKLNVRFKRIWRIDNEDDNKVASTEFLPLVVDEKIVDFQYAYYVLVSDTVTNYLCGQNANTSGSHKRISPDVLFDMDISLPSRSEQERIGRFLNDIDSKIALNREINRNLEAMARQLYDYWFVQFDFPDASGRPYKSSGGKMVWNEKLKREIPEGWEAAQMKDFLVIVNGKDHKELANGIYPVYGTGGLMRCANDYLFSGESVLLPRKGSLSNFMYVNEAFWTVDTMFHTKEKMKGAAKYIFYSLRYVDITRYDSGTGVPSMTSISYYAMPFVQPPQNILGLFNQKVSPWLKQIKRNEKGISQLNAQRDELLPLLMNGQVSVRPTAVNCDLSHD